MKKILFRAVTLVLLFSCQAIAANEVPNLITNLNKDGGLSSGAVKEKPLTENVYDLSFVAYDKKFADEFGLEEKYITSMDEHLHWMELRVQTEGQQNYCTYTLIIDKGLNLDFPDENYYDPSYIINSIFPLKTPPAPETYKPFINLKSGNKNDMRDLRFTNRVWLGNRDYKFNKSGKPFSDGLAGGIHLLYYIQDRDVPYTIISARSFCGLYGMFNNPEPAVWIRQKGKQETRLPVLSDHYTFEIPQPIVDQFRPIHELLYRDARNKTHDRD